LIAGARPAYDLVAQRNGLLLGPHPPGPGLPDPDEEKVDIVRRVAVDPHPGHWLPSRGADIGCSFANRAQHWLHTYSYTGIVSLAKNLDRLTYTPVVCRYTIRTQ
jgi:hypothetical protein